MTTTTVTQATPKLFQEFVAKKYFALSDRMQIAHDNPVNYFENYVTHHGLAAWLDSLNHCTFTEDFTAHLAKMLVVYGNRQITDVPSDLNWIARHHHIELPPVYGILTAEYWEDHAYYNPWEIPTPLAA